MRILIVLPFILMLVIVLYTNTSKFGSYPNGELLEKIAKSQNYRNGQFHNIIYEECPHHLHNSSVSLFKILKELLSKNTRDIKIPSIKTNLMDLKISEDVLVWFGHSSYFIQIEGMKILIDPVFSEVSSPIPFFPKAFNGSNIYTTKDIPEIDYLIITHDHWDHLDYATVKNLKFKKVICPLGVSAHLERWKIKNIIEMDWYETQILDNGFKVYCLPSKHFSGRKLLRNKTLWASFLLETPSSFKIFMGGDGGYDPRFSQFKKLFKEIDIAILETGQYNKNWPDKHMHPEETLKAAKDMNARILIPAHNSKFLLSTHEWNEPLEEISKLCENEKLVLLTPIIGQKVKLKDNDQTFYKWWE